MIGIIYKYTSPSNKCYIGQTYNEKERRQKFNNIKNAYGGIKIDNARRKYGPENFTYEILYTIETDDKELLMDELNAMEEYYIEKFDSIDSGYNILKGGSSYHDFVYTKEIKEKIGNASSKAIIQYDLEGNYIKSWKSASEAGRVLGIRSALISKCCNRKSKHCRNFIFRFVGDKVLDNEKNPVLNMTRNLKIIQIENDQIINEWKSITSASKELGIERHKLKSLLENGDFRYGNSILKFK